MLNCPNCNSPVSSDPVHCDVCGYRSDLAREFFWLYLGGGALVLVGMAMGSLGVLLDGAGPDHWSRTLRAWFPLAPWPESHHWLAFLVVGIALTVAGLGVTRRRPLAWLGLVGLISYQLLWVLLAAIGLAGPGDVAALAAAVGIGGVLLLALLARIGMAIWRTPGRDAHQMQLRALQKQEATAPTGSNRSNTGNDK